jgi:hypothetical protein
MAVITIKIAVTDVTNVRTLFDCIQVQRSIAGTPYSDAEFMTAVDPTAPTVVGTLEGPYIVEGLTLKFIVDSGSEQTYTFTSPDPSMPSALAAEINDEESTAFGIVASVNDGKLQLAGETLGTAGTLEITGGTAAGALGMANQKVHGNDQHVWLLDQVSSYTYNDQSGDPTYWYRTRFLHSVTGGYSSWSEWLQGLTDTVISNTLLTTGRVYLAELDGTALVGAKVTIVNVFNPLSVGGYFIAGSSRQITTDGLGKASITLIKGATVDVILEGTSIIRRIVVPSSSEFDLMDPTLVQDDPFNINVPDLPAAPRTTL